MIHKNIVNKINVFFLINAYCEIEIIFQKNIES